MKKSGILGVLLTLAMMAAGCAQTPFQHSAGPVVANTADTDSGKFQRDRGAILAMAGAFTVTFDFKETVPIAAGYTLKDPKLSGAQEVVRVVEDRGDFISLQHLLIVGSGDAAMVIKHWRQDWQYEPEGLLSFVGGNAWAWRALEDAAQPGAWSQTVYQVDDAPRYAAVATWDFSDGYAVWEPAREWRPLPRRDMTTRDDYHAIDAINRHVVTPWGWVHEQDNAKLRLSGKPQVLVHEVGVNTYQRSEAVQRTVADDYWRGTAAYWQGVRAHWSALAADNDAFQIDIKGETEVLYRPLLALAEQVQSNTVTVDDAVAEASRVIDGYIDTELAPLASRLRYPDKVAALEGVSTGIAAVESAPVESTPVESADVESADVESEAVEVAAAQ